MKTKSRLLAVLTLFAGVGGSPLLAQMPNAYRYPPNAGYASAQSPGPSQYLVPGYPYPQQYAGPYGPQTAPVNYEEPTPMYNPQAPAAAFYPAPPPTPVYYPPPAPAYAPPPAPRRDPQPRTSAPQVAPAAYQGAPAAAPGFSNGTVEEMRAAPAVDTRPIFAEAIDARRDTILSVRGDYLAWWIKNSPVPVPLVTGTNNPAAIGAIMEPGTRVLFGAGANNTMDYGVFQGGRAFATLSLSPGWSVEVGGFYLQDRSVNFQAGSPGANGAVVSIPFNATQAFNFNAAGETTLNAGATPNTVVITAPLSFWGAEANAYAALYKDSFGSGVDVLVGGRYLNLKESLNITDVFSDAFTGGSVSVRDVFQTSNDFYGCQAGLRGTKQWGCLGVGATGKLAVGTMHQVLQVQGASAVTNGAFGFPSGASVGGVFAQASNIGRFSNDALSVVPEFQLQSSVALTRHIRVFGGYNFLCATQVLRPGNQLDRNVNPTQNALFGGGGNPVGAAQPLTTLKETDFWAQGANLGVEFRW